MNVSRRRGSMAAVVCGLALSMTTGQAWAQKSGGTSSGGGGGKAPLTQTIAVPLLGGYYGVGGSGSTVATGSASLTFDSTQTLRTMSVTAGNVQLPDGTQLHVDLSSDAVYQATAYYPIWATQSAGSLTLAGYGASESISTADGLSVPLFGTAGRIVITAYSADGRLLGTVLSGTYSTVKGNKPGGRP
jgi:hypothetical protein